ncbi:TPA: hypothetical protein ACMDS1_003641 [Vibrio parahaemolyticus]|nr:hypothetical protein [Vibrio parahaemolyticus]
MRYLSKLLLLVSPLLSGCDVGEIASKVIGYNPNLYIPPMVELQVSEDHTAFVFGFDECPDSELNWILATSMTVFTNSCIKLDSQRHKVKVQFRIADNDITEDWEISRRAEDLILIRPNGFQVRKPSNQP